MPTTTESYYTTTNKQQETTERGDTTTDRGSFTTTYQQTESTDSSATTITNMRETTTKIIHTTTLQPGTTYPSDTTTVQTKEEPTTITQAPEETTLKPQGNKPGNSSCPPLEEGQAHFVCPTGFKQHPKDCQMFYQCSQSPETSHLSIVTFNCPNGTVYDESMIQCRDRRADDNCSNNDKVLRGILDSVDESSPIVRKLTNFTQLTSNLNTNY